MEEVQTLAADLGLVGMLDPKPLPRMHSAQALLQSLRDVEHDPIPSVQNRPCRLRLIMGVTDHRTLRWIMTIGTPPAGWSGREDQRRARWAYNPRDCLRAAW